MNPNSLRQTAVRGFALAAALVATGCYDSRFGMPERSEPALPVTETLAGLHARFVGEPFVVTKEVVVSGTVTTSDQAGNFYRTLCIEEERSAVEIMAGIDGLHNDYPPGCRVTLRLKGLTLAENRGVLQIGSAPEAGSGFETDYIGSRAALGRVLLRNSETRLPLQPARTGIADLSPERCGSLVRIENLRLLPDRDSDASESVVWSGYRQFVDKQGNTIYTYVRSYASFAGHQVPTAEVALVGILQYDNAGEGRYLLKMRDENDCIRMD